MKEDIIGSSGSTGMWILTAIQTNETWQLVQIILSCVVSAVTIAYILWKWWKKAKADGKITAEEIEELEKEIKDNVNKTNQ